MHAGGSSVCAVYGLLTLEKWQTRARFTPPPFTASVWAGLSHYWQDSLSIQGNEFHPWNGDRFNQREGALWNRLIIRFQTRGINWLNLFQDDLWSDVALFDREGDMWRSPAASIPPLRNSRVAGKDMHANQTKQERRGRPESLRCHLTCVSPARCATIWKDKHKKDKGECQGSKR